MSNSNYDAVSKIISQYLQKSVANNFDLKLFMAQQNLTSSQFHNLFFGWIGIEPKEFLTHATINYTKTRLSSLTTPTLFDFDLKEENTTPPTIEIIPFTPHNDTEGIRYSYHDSPFGGLLIASTSIGICFVSFIKNKIEALQELSMEFPNGTFILRENESHFAVLNYFKLKPTPLSPLQLHLKGTPFQLKVWENLLKIPKGNLTTYGSIATTLKQPNASRAIGTAIGKNPIAFLIPCHRVVQKSGKWGGYRWGIERKALLIAWEAITK